MLVVSAAGDNMFHVLILLISEFRFLTGRTMMTVGCVLMLECWSSSLFWLCEILADRKALFFYWNVGRRILRHLTLKGKALGGNDDVKLAGLICVTFVIPSLLHLFNQFIFDETFFFLVIIGLVWRRVHG